MTRQLKAQISFQKIKGLAGTSTAAGSALIIGASSTDEGTATATRGVRTDKDLKTFYTLLAKQKNFKGAREKSLPLFEQDATKTGIAGYSHVVAVGVGTSKDFFPQQIISLGGKIGQEARNTKAAQIDIYLESFYNAADSVSAENAPKDAAGRPILSHVPTREEVLEHLATGIQLSLYTFDRYKKKATSKDAKKEEPIVVRILSNTLDGRKAADILKRVDIIAEGVYLTRDLQTTPGNDMYPAEIARMAQQAGRDAGFNVQVWDEKKLKTEGMGGIVSVGQGSVNPPRFIIMEHNASKKNLPTVVLIGKGISFDTGGISIKPAQNMHEMKMDMSGSAAVIGALATLAKLKAPVHAYGLVASAENMPSGSAVKPGDIYTAYDGQTVEVLNTDAEGRLVLADALAYAKSLQPDCVIDVATLTGAVVIALGHMASGIMGNDGKLIDGFREASQNIGERTWELPLYPEYGEEMKSKVADLQNIGNDRSAGSQKGGAFLEAFVKDSYPWIHLDVAGTADTPRGQGAHCPADVGTAVPMRALVEFASKVNDYFTPKKKKK